MPNFQDNNINGRGFIIPAFEQSYLPANIFVWESTYLSPTTIIQAGVRFDYGEIHTEERTTIGLQVR